MTLCRHKPLRTMLVGARPEHSAMLEKGLSKSGLQVISTLPDASGLLFQIEQHKPQVIIVLTPTPDRELLENLSLIEQHRPTPIVMFSREEDPILIEQAIHAGVNAYRVENIDPEKVRPVIDTAIIQFKMFQALHCQLSSTERELADNKVIVQAKRLLIKQHKLSEQDAHKNLRTLAMNNSQTMATVARNVVAILENGKSER